MIKNQSVTNIIFFALLISSVWLGASIGSAIFQNPVGFDTLLSLSNILLMYFLFAPPKGFVSPIIGIKAIFPQDLKYIFSCFILAIPGYCSLRYVFELFFSIWSLKGI